jgi:hypothetical protein
MYAVLGPAVIQQLLTYYGCKVNADVATDGTKTDNEKKQIIAAWDDAVRDLTTTGVVYFVGFKTDLAAVQSVNPATADLPTPNAGWNLPAKYVQKLPQDNFLIQNQFTTYVSANIHGISGTVCGTYLRGALAQNAGVIQTVAASVRPMLVQYFEDKPAAARNAKASLYVTASNFLAVSAPSDAAATNNQKQCAATKP